MARVHRIGQTKPVHVYRLITSSSVEERMLQRADAKLYLDQMVNRGSTAKVRAQHHPYRQRHAWAGEVGHPVVGPLCRCVQRLQVQLCCVVD
jgi:hypothetical protein